MKVNFYRFRELYRSFYNLFYYFKVIWSDRDWDHAYMWYLQLDKFEKAYEYRTTSKYCCRCVGQEKHDQALRICIILLKRFISGHEEFYTQDGWQTTIHSIEERDWKIYCKLIENYQRTWWD